MKPNQNTNEPIEFYEHTTNIDPNFCDHRFHRLSVTRIVCKRCGLGFFDTPFDPFPVTEMNNMARKQKEENEKSKENLNNKEDIAKKD